MQDLCIGDDAVPPGTDVKDHIDHQGVEGGRVEGPWGWPDSSSLTL